MFNDDILKQLENYQNAEEVDIDKAIGNDPICFTEYEIKNGVKTERIRKALPVICSRHNELKILSKELQKKQKEHRKLGIKTYEQTIDLSSGIQKLIDELEEVGKKIVEATKEKKEEEIRVLQEKRKELQEQFDTSHDEIDEKMATLNDAMEASQLKVQEIQLKIAQLVFSRAEGELPIEKIQAFLDPQQLNLFEYIAFGQSIPPNVLPGKVRKKRK